MKLILQDGFENIVVSKTIVTTSESKDQIKDLIKRLERQMSVAFLDGKFEAMTRYDDGFGLKYRGIRYYQVKFYLEEFDPNDMKMFDLIESEMGQVI